MTHLERRRSGQHDASFIREILAKARELHGIGHDEALALLQMTDPELACMSFLKPPGLLKTKSTATGWCCSRRSIFQISAAMNACTAPSAAQTKLSCARLSRRRKSPGRRKCCLRRAISGCSWWRARHTPKEGLEYIFRSIETIYSVSTPKGQPCAASMSILRRSRLRSSGSSASTASARSSSSRKPTTGKPIKNCIPAGLKANYDFRLEAMDRAFQGGLKDLGIGILFGLHDWRYEILALLQHIAHLEKNFGVGPHTISVPRLEPAVGSDISTHPPYPVTDDDFRKIIAVLRIAVPYTGIILSTRESAAMRREAFELGVSQISAGSRTNPGGYSESAHETGEQFSLGDTRPLMAVIKDIVEHNHIPSFCTGCYRLGRVGKDFMDMAKPGLIKQHCLPNAMFTFAEYLHDFADGELKEKGFALIDQMIRSEIDDRQTKTLTLKNLERIAAGERDIYL